MVKIIIGILILCILYLALVIIRQVKRNHIEQRFLNSVRCRSGRQPVNGFQLMSLCFSSDNPHFPHHPQHTAQLFISTFFFAYVNSIAEFSHYNKKKSDSLPYFVSHFSEYTAKIAAGLSKSVS